MKWGNKRHGSKLRVVPGQVFELESSAASSQHPGLNIEDKRLLSSDLIGKVAHRHRHIEDLIHGLFAGAVYVKSSYANESLLNFPASQLDREML